MLGWMFDHAGVEFSDLMSLAAGFQRAEQTNQLRHLNHQIAQQNAAQNSSNLQKQKTEPQKKAIGSCPYCGEGLEGRFKRCRACSGEITWMTVCECRQAKVIDQHTISFSCENCNKEVQVAKAKCIAAETGSEVAYLDRYLNTLPRMATAEEKKALEYVSALRQLRKTLDSLYLVELVSYSGSRFGISMTLQKVLPTIRQDQLDQMLDQLPKRIGIGWSYEDATSISKAFRTNNGVVRLTPLLEVVKSRRAEIQF